MTIVIMRGIFEEVGAIKLSELTGFLFFIRIKKIGITYNFISKALLIHKLYDISLK